MRERYDIELLREYENKGLITGRNHPSLPLVVWNYTAATQYGRLWDEVTLSTRGLVTDVQGNTVAPCIPKFFNLGETDYSIKDFSTAYEKLDGSLIHVFKYDGQWVCSSRGSFESDHAKWAQELVDKNLHLFKEYEYTDVVFVCELIIPENRIVVDYGDEESLRLISAFIYSSRFGWEETRPQEWNWPWTKVKLVPVEDLPEYLEQSNIEGVVLLNAHGRVKVKTQEYVELHRIVTELTTKRVFKHYLEHGNVDALLEVVPDEWYERIGMLVWKFDNAVNFLYALANTRYQRVVEGLGSDATRKDFAMAVKGQRDAPFMFALKDGKDVRRMIQEAVASDYERYDLEL